jgi:hypothetical protein
VRTWLPTAFGASVLVAEIPLVYAAAARSADGARALAALGICLAVLVVVNTPALSLTPLVAMEAGRRGLRRYALAVGAAGALVLLLLGVVPPAAHLVRLAFGLDAPLLRHVRDGLVALAPNALGVALRRELHGRLVHAGRTGPIVAATAVRIVGTGVLAFAAVAIWPDRGALAGWERGSRSRSPWSFSPGRASATSGASSGCRTGPRCSPRRGCRCCW